MNYTTTERELRGLVFATCEEFRVYLFGCEYQLQGDHRPLATLMEPSRPLSRRQARWVETLQENDVPQMTWVPGTALAVPDALSRRRDYELACPDALEGLRESVGVSRKQFSGLSDTLTIKSGGQDQTRDT